MSSIHERNGRHILYWRDPDGAQHSRSFTNRKHAEALKREVDEDAALGRPWQPRVARRAPRLEAGMIAYLTDRSRVLAPSTLHRYAIALEIFKDFAGADADVSILSRQTMAEYFGWLRDPANGRHGRQRSINTTTKLVGIAQELWAWLAGDDAFTGFVAPVRRIELRREAPTPAVAPTWAEMDAMIAAAAGWHRQLAIVLRFTGLRVAQALAIRWEHVDVDAATLVVASGKSAQEKRGRIIPISRHLAQELAGWGVREGFVIDCPRKERTPRARDFERAWIRAGVRAAAWQGHAHHAFRKGFISGLKRLGADDEAVKVLVGHSLGLRGVYVDADALGLRAAVDLVPARDAGAAVVALRGAL